jgi:hypothetical protein
LIETAFGLDYEDDEDGSSSRRLVRRRPTTVPLAAAERAAITEADPEDCAQAIRAMLFLSKGHGVFVSPERESDRHVTGTYQLRVQGQPDKTLLPLGFCRERGQEYLVVTIAAWTRAVQAERAAAPAKAAASAPRAARLSEADIRRVVDALTDLTQ